MTEIFKKYDIEILRYINMHHSPFWDSVMWWCSGQYTWIPFYLLLVIIILIKLKKKAIPLVLLIAVLITFSDQLASSIIKPLFHRLRPSHNPDIENLLHYVNGYRGGLYGFVSSHAANTFSLAFYFFFTLRKPFPVMVALVFIWAVIVSYSRMYLGVHYPSDILVPFFLAIANGWMISELYWWIIKKYYNKGNTINAGASL